MKYSYHPYHKYFKKRAQEEIRNIKKTLPKSKIEHFGSTSIPGVGGKGIIDIYVSVLKKDLDKASIQIQKIGYEFKPSGGIPNERLFHQKNKIYPNGKKQIFHAHLTYFGNGDWIKSLAFRDFLINHSELAKEYSDIKHKAVIIAKGLRTKKEKKEAYMNAKRPVIDKILRLMDSEINDVVKQ